MKWNGREYRPARPSRISVYPPREDSMADLLRPLAEKERKGNIWIPVLNQPLNVKDPITTPPASPSVTPTISVSPTVTPSISITPTISPSVTPTPSPSVLSEAAISYITWAETSSFSSLNVGGTGLVVVVVQGENNTGTSTINTVTLDGVAMTQATKSNYNGLLPQGIYYGENAGSTVDIVATFTGTNLRSGIAVWLITNYNSTTPEFVDGQTFGATTSRSVTTSSLSAGSVGVSALNNTVSAGRTFTWTNATKVFDVGYSAATGEGTGADFSQSSSGARTITVSGLGNTGGNTFNTATWR